MDQRNTIVKCNATTCLYNYKGICEQYVIDLDMYGQCKEYCETEQKVEEEKIQEENTSYVEISKNCDHCQYRVYGLSHPYCELHKIFIYDNNFPCSSFKPIRRQRANIAGLIEDGWVDPEIVKEVCKPFVMGVDLSDDKV